MKTYIGSKLVKAKPFTKHEFRETVKNQVKHSDEDEKGFLVEYPDGYQSWNTMDEFNRISRIITDDEYRSFFGVEPNGSLDENGFQWYIQTKVINAEPTIKGNDIPNEGTQEDKYHEEGYRIIYPNGHESWSPTVKFEEAYREISGLEETLVKESWLQGQLQTNKPD